MTDGEYNIHYATESAKNQALALCTAMKAKGVKVYTIGFGFSTSSTAADNTTEGRAKDLMQQCASPAASGESNNYYFPYDGTALRSTFSQHRQFADRRQPGRKRGADHAVTQPNGASAKRKRRRLISAASSFRRSE